MTRAECVDRVIDWYGTHARDLPWRRPDVSPWGVMVSEVMLQQTPVDRVVGPWHAWMQRWPTPSALAAEPVGEAIRAWGRLGYPRRAQRLHAAARVMVAEHGGSVPSDLADLRALPGIGEYSAAAIASFAFAQRHLVLDTNVRRVLARADAGTAQAPATLTQAERARALAWLPDDASTASRWAVASMELGARVCVATKPDCPRCPLRECCAWLADGRPELGPPRRAAQSYAGTDRQCRGVLLGILRAATEPVDRATLMDGWSVDPDQAERCLASLLRDELVHDIEPGLFSL